MDRVAGVFERIARLAGRRPVPVLVIGVLLAAGGGALALKLEPTVSPDTLVPRGSDTFAATERYHERFGDDAVIVLIRQKLTDLVLTPDIERVLGLEGCLSGNLPRGARPPGGTRGPCAQLASLRPAKVVYGPGTFLNESVRQIQQQFTGRQQEKAREARRAGRAAEKIARSRGRSPAEARRLGRQAQQLVYAQFVRDSLQLALRYGLTDVPRLNDPGFVASVVFDAERGFETPKARFAYLFPRPDSALVQVRLRPDLSEAERRRAIALIRDATEMPQWRLAKGGSYTVTGAPVVVSDLTSTLTRSIVVLLVAALLVMAATLALVFRARARLLPLAMALMAAGLTFGAMALVGAPLTLAAIAVLPVLIGLAVDYAIQFQSRWQEEGEDVARAARAGGPTIATAGLATVAGFLVLLLSPIPMVRGFGVLLVAGIVLAFLATITAGFAALALVGRRERTGAAARGGRGRLRGLAAASARGAGDLVRGARTRIGRLRPVWEARDILRDGVRQAFDLALRHPRRLLLLAVAACVLGWAADLTVTDVESDITRLVPQDVRALRDLQDLQRSTGVAGQVDVVVEGENLADPRVVQWMGDYQRAVLRRFGYSSARGCGRAAICPALSLPDLFAGGQAQGRGRRARLSREQVEGLLDTVPPYFSQSVITPDRRTATLAFGIRLMPLERQQAVLDVMRERLDPPRGVSARLAGLPAQAAEANAQIASPWRRLAFLLAGLLAVGAVLLLVYRRLEHALVPLLPVALATGVSALLLVLFNLNPLVAVPLNPMSVTLGALVIAISTEFSVLLAARFRAERARGLDLRAALERTYRTTGLAVAASGLTAIAGFAVLMLSDITLLRGFGFVTVLDLAVALVSVLIVLPAVLVLADRGELLGLPGTVLRRLKARGRALPGVRRRVAA